MSSQHTKTAEEVYASAAAASAAGESMPVGPDGLNDLGRLLKAQLAEYDQHESIQSAFSKGPASQASAKLSERSLETASGSQTVQKHQSSSRGGYSKVKKSKTALSAYQSEAKRRVIAFEGSHPTLDGLSYTSLHNYGTELNTLAEAGSQNPSVRHANRSSFMSLYDKIGEDDPQTQDELLTWIQSLKTEVPYPQAM